MIELVVKNCEGGQAGTLSIDEATLGGTVNRELLRQVVMMYEANRRVGCAAVKSRNQVVGSGRKLYRQKGTGYARVGNAASPIRRGGGVAHGPKPRDYSYHLPRKALRRAVLSAVLAKLQDGQVMVVDEIKLPESKTKIMAACLKALGVTGSTLIITAGHDKEVVRSARNIPGVRVKRAEDVNAWDLLACGVVLVVRDALGPLSLVEVA